MYGNEVKTFVGRWNARKEWEPLGGNARFEREGAFRYRLKRRARGIDGQNEAQRWFRHHAKAALAKGLVRQYNERLRGET